MASSTQFPKPDISPCQIRAARALLDWTLVVAAERMGVGKNTLNRIETGRSVPGDRTMRDIVTVFEEAGIQFVTAEAARGVMLANQSTVDS